MILPVKKGREDTAVVLPDIIRAAYRSDYQTVRKLLEIGVDVNTVDPRDNLTCLHIAGMQGDVTLADIILTRDAEFGDVDFSIRSLHRPRLAWQYAINGNFFELGRRIDAAGLAKSRSAGAGLTPPSL